MDFGEVPEWRKLLDELNDVEVSKGVLGYLDTRHHPNEGQFFTTTDVLRSLWSLQKGSRKIGVSRRSFNALTSPQCL